MKLEEVLTGIETHSWTSEPDVAKLIANIIELHQFKRIVEVGVFKGFTTAHILNSLQESGSYIGIDIKDFREESVKEFFKEKNAEYRLGDSKLELKKLENESADLIFLDGDHSLDYVKTEFLESLRIIRKNGIICLHDYYSFGVKTWVDFIAKSSKYEVFRFHSSNNCGVAIVRCKNPDKSPNMALFKLFNNSFTFKLRDKIRYSFQKKTDIDRLN